MTTTTKKRKSAGASAPAKARRVEIMDTTLRDGEQTEGISLMPEEKLVIARQLLLTLRVDRIEVASARVSAGEVIAVKKITEWARQEEKASGGGLIDRIEILGFVDFNASVEWAKSVGCKVINLLTKGSEKHCREQLRKTHEQHIADIEKTVLFGKKHGITFNVYLEDWSNGMLHSPDYTMNHIAALDRMPIHRIMLCDTLGILNPWHVRDFLSRTCTEFPDRHFDYHGHNDYGLATANALESVVNGARGVHVTMNGMGERAGNTCLDEVAIGLRDHLGAKMTVNEKALKEISHLIEVFSGRRIASNKPITGDTVFTQTAGIHADGDMKGDLYQSRLTPSRFGRDRVYAMGKLMGKASLDFNLEKMKIKLTPEQKKLALERIVQLGDQKKVITAEDLPFIVSDILESPESRIFQVLDYMVASNRGLAPTATVKVSFRGEELQATASGDGGYDAFMNALHSLEKKMGIKIPKLEDYEVHIPPGGKTDALVETTIKWEGGLKTRAVHSDQLAAAIEATSHAVNMIALNGKKH